MEYINITKKNNYAIVQLNRRKVNAINHQVVNEIREAFSNLNSDNEVAGVIMTGIPRFFSAGLDVIELYQYDEDKMRAFMTDFGNMHIELVRFPKPFVCTINGYSPAGGTVIAIAADHRIMVEDDKYTIGLNEVAVNIQISHNIISAYSFWIGKGLAHRYLLSGKLLNVKEALACGLIDELVSEEQLLAKAEEKMKSYLMAHPMIFQNTKSKLRHDWISGLEKYDQEDLEQALQTWWKPEVRKRMEYFIKRLTTKA